MGALLTLGWLLLAAYLASLIFAVAALAAASWIRCWGRRPALTVRGAALEPQEVDQT